MIRSFPTFTDAVENCIRLLKHGGSEVDTGKWQGVSTEGHPDMVTVELMDASFRVHMDLGEDHEGFQFLELARQIKPNLPWADDHFEERVSRVPSNPGEQYKNWPWWRGQDEETRIAGPTGQEPQFTHTYQERFWPKTAGTYATMRGIRYDYGDLDDVVNMLVKDPYTRQAYLPIFFPEDTGAVHGGRIPCSLGYHFLLRNSQLHLWYDIRSCDAVRHFRDDVYLAARLALWVIEECAKRSEVQGIADRSETSTLPVAGKSRFLWHTVRPGIMTFSAHSFHVHKGDLHLL